MGIARREFGKRSNLVFHAWIEAPDRRAIPCVVGDLTLVGASIFASHTLPPSFRLVIEAKGLKHRCQIVDQTERKVEVAFV
jgi:hypothetical protein